MSGRARARSFWLGTTLLACVIPLVPACKLDSLLFNSTRLSSYALSTGIIPDSARAFVSLRSGGSTIYGFMVVPPEPRRAETILYCHGNTGSIEYYWDRIEMLYQGGYRVFVFDYQGYGMSEGDCSEDALYSDGRAALQYLFGRRDVDRNAIVVYGFSLGCAVAIDLAARVYQPRVLVCEAPFASGEALIQSGTLLDIPGQTVLKGEYNNAAKIRSVHAPFLLFHGIDDRFIDIAKNGQVVFENANEPKQFIRVPGAGHSTIPQAMGIPQYLTALANFIDAVPRPAITWSIP